MMSLNFPEIVQMIERRWGKAGKAIATALLLLAVIAIAVGLIRYIVSPQSKSAVNRLRNVERFESYGNLTQGYDTDLDAQDSKDLSVHGNISYGPHGPHGQPGQPAQPKDESGTEKK